MCLNTLRRIYNQQSTFTSRDRTRNFVRKVNVSGSVNQVQNIFFAFVHIFHLNGVTFNRDATFAFQIHVVKQLCFFFTGCHSLSGAQKSVGQSAFSVVNVGNNAKVSNVFHLSLLSFFVKPNLLDYVVSVKNTLGFLLFFILFLN